MKKKALFLIIAYLQLVFGCLGTLTIDKPKFRPFKRSQPISEKSLQEIHKESQKDAVFADLLQAFALMRQADIENPKVRQQITSLLVTSVNSFEDMSDPKNFSKAFTADESKPYRGWPHERMFASIMAGVFYMAEGRCEMALPYFRNAEFLEARFQKLPFTDAPLIYALTLRCLQQKGADIYEQKKAKNGIFKSVRFLSLQEELLNLLNAADKADLRTMAISNRMAYIILEISLYSSLLSAPKEYSIEKLIDDAVSNASLFVSVLVNQFGDEYRERLEPMVKELAKVLKQTSKSGIEALNNFAMDNIYQETKVIGENLKKIWQKEKKIRERIQNSLSRTEYLSQKIIKAALAPKLILNFTGYGPKLEREGSYGEVISIKTSPDGSDKPFIRQKKIFTPTKCGFHRTKNEGFALVLCSKESIVENDSKIESLQNIEILSLSRKAKTVLGRKFDKILKGRAKFKAATEEIATISAWSSLFLFHLANQAMENCRINNPNQSCYAGAYAIYGAASVTGIFTGIIWLIGRPINPSADSRYLHLMYESVWMSI